MALASPSRERIAPVGTDLGAANSLAFMPRLFVLTTLPHRRPKGNRFERVNGWQTLRMVAPRRIGLPYGVYPRLLLMFITTEAVRRKSREIHLGTTPNDLARKLGLSVISGPRGTERRLEAQLHRLLHMRLDWQTSLGLAPRSSESVSVAASGTPWLKPLQRLLPRKLSWQAQIVLGRDFLEEIRRSAVPVDLRAIHQLNGSPLALDLYTWLTYRMSYLRKPTLIPWEGLQVQFGADFSRDRDFRRHVLGRLSQVVSIYPEVRVASRPTGLLLLPSPAHIPSRLHRQRPQAP